MNLAQRVSERARAASTRLSLAPGAVRILEALAQMDLDGARTAERQQADEQGRKSVISWARLSEEWDDEATDLAEALGGLTRWGLVQVVGQTIWDPAVAGSAALRLTYAGRATLGIAPPLERVATAQLPMEDEPSPWEIWHGASREGLLYEASRRLGPAALAPIRLQDAKAIAADVAGRVALLVVQEGCAVVDVFGLNPSEYAPILEQLFARTALARGPRLLIANNPAIARVAALATGARLRWVEVPLHGSQHVGLYDQRLTERLMREHTAPGALQVAVCGMPESDRAIPRRVSVQWDDLLFAPAVRHQLDQALAHARFRTEILPGRPKFPGQGAGYRLLLSGVPGTGKSMASEALASALDRPLLVLDLSAVLSKWLGETEKFLAQVFEMAELSGCVLLLDEAEALFQQRKGDEGGGGGGGGALQTIVAFLLTRLERYSGVLVATTNRVKDLDEAFFRRFDDFIVVPIPDLPTRQRMWRRMLGIEINNGDVDIELLANKFAVSGGLIRGAALRSLAWSNGLGRGLSTPLVLAALARELEKNDRAATEAYVEPHRAEVLALLKGGVSSAWD